MLLGAAREAVEVALGTVVWFWSVLELLSLIETVLLTVGVASAGAGVGGGTGNLGEIATFISVLKAAECCHTGRQKEAENGGVEASLELLSVAVLFGESITQGTASATGAVATSQDIPSPQFATLIVGRVSVDTDAAEARAVKGRMPPASYASSVVLLVMFPSRSRATRIGVVELATEASMWMEEQLLLSLAPEM